LSNKTSTRAAIRSSISAGKDQTLLITARDAVGAIGAVSTSVMVLAKAPKSALAAVGIGTGAAYTGIDIYTKDFLFSADNIDAVRTLTNNALDTHHQAVSDALAADGSKKNYDYLVRQLRDEQSICTLRHIAALAVDAIKNGHLVATTNTPDQDIANIARIQDETVLAALGTAFQTSGPLTSDEAVALWELLVDRTDDPTRLSVIETQLANLPAATSPFDQSKAGTHTLVSPWPLANPVQRLLQSFSAATKTGFEAAILQSKNKQAKDQAAADAQAAAAAKASGQMLLGPVHAPPVAVAPVTAKLGSGNSTSSVSRFDIRAQ
jgi:hypothetical protein